MFAIRTYVLLSMVFCAGVDSKGTLSVGVLLSTTFKLVDWQLSFQHLFGHVMIRSLRMAPEKLEPGSAKV